MTLPTAAKQREISFDELRDMLNQKLTVIVGTAGVIREHFDDEVTVFNCKKIEKEGMEISKFLREVKVVSKP